MKNKLKKAASLMLAFVMVLALGATSFAADSGYGITVENSIGGATYNAYKVFDAQYDGDAVSYSIDSGSPWYAAVSSATDVFTLTNYGGSTYHVEVKSGVPDSAVIAVFENVYGSLQLTAAASGTGNGGTLELDVSEPGYYFVTTSTGSVVSITTAAPTATIIDKNQTPGNGGYDPEDPGWNGGFTKDAGETSYSVGDKVDYTVKSYVPTYDGTKEVTSYTITDVMGAGLTYDNDMTVYISGSSLDGYEDITDFCTITLDANTNTLTVTWSPIAIEEAGGYVYPADAVVTIHYTDTVNEAADETDLTNSVALSWLKIDPDDPNADPEEDSRDETPEVTVYTYGFDLTKTDGNKVLEGAQFTLQKSGSDALITFLYDEASDTYEEWDGMTAGDTTTTITVSDGDVNVWGLGAGTYTLTEIAAPDGYNLLDAPVTVEIVGSENGWTVSVNGTTSVGAFISDTAETDGHGVAVMPVITIVNNAGSVLPGTGGIGTTLFYVIGGILILGAAVVFAARRRMRSDV